MPSAVLARAEAAADAVIPAIGADGRLYRAGKMDAHRRGLKHLAVSVFVFDADRLLIQRRAATKYHCAGLWANACCSHPHWDESVEAAAARRLREELGVEGLKLSRAATIDYRAPVTMGLVENERVTIFRGDADADALAFDLNPDEVSAVRWIALGDLRREAAEAPEAFAPWLRIYLSRWEELGL